MSTPRASIVIIGYRAEGTIAAAVESALAQTVPDVEVVVVDDGSDDGTRRVVEEIASRTADPRLVIAPPAPNGGPSAARNRGLALSRSPWIAFLDSDDTYEPQFVARMLAAAEETPSAHVVVCSHMIVPVDGPRRVRTPACGVGVMTGRDAAITFLEDRLTPYVWDKLFAREVLGDDPFPTDIHRAEDAVVVLGACLAADRVRVITDALQIYVVSTTSLTWGRVAPIAESAALMERLRELAAPVLDSAPGRRALDVSTVLTYLNTAHQAIIRLPGAERAPYVRACARRVRWSEIVGALRARPALGAAAVLLKAAPWAYRRAYRAYVRRAYAITD